MESLDFSTQRSLHSKAPQDNTSIYMIKTVNGLVNSVNTTRHSQKYDQSNRIHLNVTKYLNIYLYLKLFDEYGFVENNLKNLKTQCDSFVIQ